MTERTRTGILALLAVVLVLGCGRPALGWGSKDHVLITRMAARELLEDPATPSAMKDWLRQATPGLGNLDDDRQILLRARFGPFPRGVDGLPYWAVMPDLAADSSRPDSKVEPFGVHERMLHFVDLELLSADEGRRTYADDLSNKPVRKDIPRDMADPRWKQVGMLPFRVEDCSKNLVRQIRAGRLNDAPGQFPRDEHATRWAGYLAHYAADNTQPHHATIDYKSRSYFNDPPRTLDPHRDIEWGMVDGDEADHPKLREELWEAWTKQLRELKDPTQSDDPWEATVEVALASYDALPLIGRAAVAAYGADGQGAFDAEAFFRTKGTFAGQELTVLQLKARQMAWATKRIERLWLRAWQEASAGTPPPTQPAGIGGR